jgi:transcriptional regulator GlxA family with amidase domain
VKAALKVDPKEDFVVTAQPLAPRLVAIIVFEGAQLLDAAGPADVFSLANHLMVTPAYRLRLLSSGGGWVTMSNGLRLETRAVRKAPASGIDTLIVAGGDRDGLVGAVRDPLLRRWVMRAAPKLRRLASVCSGAFALAQWGLLDHLRATTHWSAVSALQHHYPAVRVQADALFVQDGAVWTSGGVTTGIDMCLAMLEADHGRGLATQVAKQLVMSSRRVGNQSQYSAELQAQAGRYAELVDWLRLHLRDTLSIAALAARVGESERSFCRHFAQDSGYTPAAFVETLRVQAAQRQLEGGASAKAAARAAGFTSDQHLARAFKRRLAMSPMAYQRAHAVGTKPHAPDPT